MTSYDALCERLRKWHQDTGAPTYLEDAAAAIRELRDDNERLRGLLMDGLDAIEMHTLYDECGAVSLRGSYRCVDDCEIDQWTMRARAALAGEKP